MKNKQWEAWLNDSPRSGGPLPAQAQNQPYSPGPPPDPMPEQPSVERAPSSLRRRLGWTAAIVLLFCMSILAGMMSEGKGPKLANIFKGSSQGAVKGDNTHESKSTLSVSQGGGVGQAPGIQEKTATLTADSPYFQYIEKVGGVDVTISRQPLPEEFKTTPNALQKVAKNIGANQSLPTGKRGTAYVLTDGTVQVVAFVYEQKLVFARSLQLIPMETWKTFIDNHKVL